MTATLTEAETARLNGLWAVAERTGLTRCQKNLDVTLADYEAAVTARRDPEVRVAEAQAAYDEAVGFAELDASRWVTREGNKTFVPDGDSGEHGPRQVSADEAKTWVARRVAADPAVVAAARLLQAERIALEEAKDRIVVAEQRLRAARYVTDSAIAMTNLLSLAFKETQL